MDGFRFDATHTDYTDHGFLHRLAEELKGFKPDVLLVAENLPNQSDLNRQGWNGFAQWSDPFHDKIKALLREGLFGDVPPAPDGMADAFYFGKGRFAAHTNNAINYSESHDETSIPFEVGTNPTLNHPAAKERKGRLGLLAALVALGQPMLYMGQEFNVERDRNIVSFRGPSPPDHSGFYRWVRLVIGLRRRYPGLRLTGFDPAGDGRFAWILGPWMDGDHGGGHRVWGWRARPSHFAHDALVIMLNFEGHAIVVEVDLGIPGTWVKLADIDREHLKLILVPAADDVHPEAPLANVVRGGHLLGRHERMMQGDVDRAEHVEAMGRRQQATAQAIASKLDPFGLDWPP